MGCKAAIIQKQEAAEAAQKEKLENI